jgi:integrase
MTAPNKHRLNDLFIGRLQPRTSGPYLVWDILQRGLAVQVQPTGHRAYKCIYTRRGRSRWYHIADAAAIDVASARKLALKVMVQVAEGLDPAADRRASRHADTFEDLAVRYRKYSERENKSWRQSDKLVQRHLLPSWGKLPAADISRSDVNAMMSRIKAPIVANQTLAAASAIFSWAIKKELASVKINPCHGIDRNKTTSRERVLSVSEIPRFWAAFDDAGLLESMVLKTVLLTGQRPGEVKHMRVEHIEDGWWTLPGEPVPALDWPGTKNGQSHRIWLPKVVQDIIAELEPTGLVFAGPRGGVLHNLDLAMRAICKELGIERATPHDLRRTHGTTIASLGFGRDAMNRIQNHKEGGIASVYDRHRYTDENKKIMEAVANKIMSLVSAGPDNVIAFVGAAATK